MRKTFFIFQFVALFVFLLSPPFSHAFETDPDIAKAYSASDYVTVAKILDQQIKSLKEKSSKGEDVNYLYLHRKYLFLAHIHVDFRVRSILFASSSEAVRD